MIRADRQGDHVKVQRLVKEAGGDVEPSLSRAAACGHIHLVEWLAAEWSRRQQEDKWFGMDTSCACLRLSTIFIQGATLDGRLFILHAETGYAKCSLTVVPT